MSVSTRPGSRPMRAPFTTASNVFNTANSMGRLTLNMLLSFAQFEREVTAERIRDKIAASKAKGMWMGGIVPLGYKAFGRTLTISGGARRAHTRSLPGLFQDRQRPAAQRAAER